MCSVKLMGQSDSKISHVDVIKITEMRLEVERKAPEKKMDNHSFLFSHSWFFIHFVPLPVKYLWIVLSKIKRQTVKKTHTHTKYNKG